MITDKMEKVDTWICDKRFFMRLYRMFSIPIMENKELKLNFHINIHIIINFLGKYFFKSNTHYPYIYSFLLEHYTKI